VKNCIVFILVLLLTPVIGAAPPQQPKGTETGLPWAYGFATPASATKPGAAAPAAAAPAAAPPAEPAEDRDTVRHLPGSTAALSLKQVDDNFGPGDWYPGDHPAMPEVVAHGRKPDVRACGFCHYPNGKGRPNNAGPAGLPASYILQQLENFRNGDRKSWDTRKANTNQMIAIARGMTDDEMKAAANYFAAMKWTSWVKVVETDTVPKTHFVGGGGGLCLPLEGGGTEPLGRRIVETPANPEDTEPMRNPRSGFIAYVPVGSVKRGEALATKGGGGKTVACAACHGPGLKGDVLGYAPSLAGRSPSYLARQLYDIQKGTRTDYSRLMKMAVENLSEDDILDITAYVASLAP
jgi:cytochrome c553